MTGWVAHETLTEGALTGRVPTEAILTTAFLTEVEKTVSQEDQWMPVGRLPWTGQHSHQDLIPMIGEVQCLLGPLSTSKSQQHEQWTPLLLKDHCL